MKLFSNLLFLFVLINISVIAQNELTAIKGRVVDSETGEGVAFASIGVEGTYIGVATNADGFYDLKIKNEFLNHVLYVSAISYKNVKFNISEIKNKNNHLIYLQAQLFDIEEVSVSAESMFLQKIIKTASENIPINYLSGPQNIQMNLIHRKSVDNGNSLVSRFIIDIYDSEAYTKPSIKSAFNNRNYKVVGFQSDEEIQSFRKSDFKIDELLNSDVVRMSNMILNAELLLDYNLNLEEKTVFNGDSIWIISYQAKNPTLANSGAFYPAGCKGKIYISMVDFSVLRNEIYVDEIKSNLQGKYLAPGKKYNINAQNKITCRYSKIGTRYGLVLIEIEKSYFSHEKKSVYESYKARLIYNLADRDKKIESRDYYFDNSKGKLLWTGFSELN